MATLIPILRNSLENILGEILPRDFFTINSNFLTSVLPSNYTFSRASTATDIIAGALTSFSSNAPRINSENGLLQEATVTNLVKNSSSVATAGTLVGGQTDPWGGSAAFLYTATATTTGQQWSVGSSTVAYTYNHTYTASAYVKAGTFDRVQMFLSATIVPSGTGYANFYLSGAGSVSASGASAINPGIEQLGTSGWYRIWFSFTSNTTTNHTLAFCKIVTGSETRAPSVAGGSQTMYFYGAQVEDAKAVSSLIPTTTATVQRLVDSVTLPLPGCLDTITVTAKTPKSLSSSDSPVLIRLTDGSKVLDILRYGATGEIKLVSTGLFSNIDISSGIVVPASTVFSVTAKVSNGFYTISVNGSSLVSGSASPINPSSLTLGPSWGGYVQTLALSLS